MVSAARLCVLVSVLLSATFWSRVAPAQTASKAARAIHRHAIVIGSNAAGGQATLPPLEFADDDALNNCELLAELGMSVTAFTSVDDATGRKHPNPNAPTPGGIQTTPHPAAGRCTPREPTVRNIEDHIRAVVNEVKATPDVDNIIVVWFSGHGSGSALFLEDAPLPTERLRTLLLEPTRKHAQIHLILDSCHAAKFVRGRGEEQKPNPDFERQLRSLPQGLDLANNPHVGALIGATLTNKVHEYSAIEAGILSYELRAAFRNAADATGDRKVTFREAEVFVFAANVGVTDLNARIFGHAFLPHNRDVAIADWNDAAANAIPHVSLTLPAEEKVRFRISDARGVALVEAHKGKEEDTSRIGTIFLPANQPYRVEILSDGGELVDYRKLESSAAGSIPFPYGSSGPRPRDSMIESLEEGLFRRHFDRDLFDVYIAIKASSSDSLWLESRGGSLEPELGGPPAADAATPTKAPGPVRPVDTHPPSRVDSGGARAWPYVLGGTAAAAVATGVVFNVLARSENEKAEGMCEGSTNGVCTVDSSADKQELQDHLDAAKTHRTISYVSFGIGGLAMVGGAVILLTSDPKQPVRSTWLSPRVGAKSASVFLGGNF
jgi:hypothetical protein